MPLDDREQRILAEIERQFYEDDPDLAKAVKNIDRSNRLGLRLPALGLFVGLLIVVVFFTSQTLIALIGFALMVVSATAVVQVVRIRGWGDSSRETDSGDSTQGSGWPFRRG